MKPLQTSERRFIAVVLLMFSILLIVSSCNKDDAHPTQIVLASSINFSADSVSFSAFQGGPDPLNDTVLVTDGSAGALTGLSTEIGYNGTTGWLTASLTSTTAPTALILHVTKGSLTQGSYYARVAVTSQTANNSPQQVYVMLTISASTPKITLSKSTVGFTAQPGGANPASQTVSVTNGGGGSLTGLSISISYGSGSGWLTATLNSSTAPATITLQAVTGSLTTGVRGATLSVSSPTAGNSPQTVSVLFSIGSPPAMISLSALSIGFTAQQGGGNPASQTVNVTNGGGNSLTGLSTSISYGSGSGWLTASLNTTTAPATITLHATTGSLAAGTYSASVSVASPSAANSPRTISVTFTVSSSSASIILSASSVTFTASQGGGNPASQTVNVTNGGGSSVTGLSASVSYSSGSGWLTASLNTTTAPAVVTLQPTTGSLAAGTYTATVSIASAVASNSPRTISVTLTVGSVSSPLIVLSDSIEEFTVVAGTGTKYPTPVQVTNGGGGTLTNLAASVNYGSGSGWMNAILNTTTAPTTLFLSVLAGNLTPGVYTANVFVSSSVAANSPKKISITATITTPPVVEKTYFASYDNLLMDNSADTRVAGNVYSGNELAVGTDYFYRIDGSYDFIEHASLFKFDPQSDIAGKTIDTAIVSLYEYILPGDPGATYEFAAIATVWNPATVTWNKWVSSMQYYNSHLLYFKSIGTTSVAHTFEVTAIVRGWANGSLSNNGFQIWEPYPAAPGYESYQSTEIQSLEVYRNSAQRPQIFIRYH